MTLPLGRLRPNDRMRSYAFTIDSRKTGRAGSFPTDLCGITNVILLSHYAFCIQHSAFGLIPYALCPMPYALCTMHYPLYTIHYALSTMHYELFTMHYTLYIFKTPLPSSLSQQTPAQYLLSLLLRAFVVPRHIYYRLSALYPLLLPIQRSRLWSYPHVLAQR